MGNHSKKESDSLFRKFSKVTLKALELTNTVSGAATAAPPIVHSAVTIFSANGPKDPTPYQDADGTKFSILSVPLRADVRDELVASSLLSKAYFRMQSGRFESSDNDGRSARPVSGAKIWLSGGSDSGFHSVRITLKFPAATYMVEDFKLTDNADGYWFLEVEGDEAVIRNRFTGRSRSGIPGFALDTGPAPALKSTMNVTLELSGSYIPNAAIEGGDPHNRPVHIGGGEVFSVGAKE